MIDKSNIFITSAPLRVSLLGGGTDIPKFYEQYGTGKVIGFAINKYVNILAQKINFNPNFKFRLSYSKNEDIYDVNKIKHPIFKVLLNNLNYQFPIHFSSKSNIYSGSGLGSSSSFTVALVGMIDFINNKKINKKKIAIKSSYTERVLLKEAGGLQDQYFASYGNIRKFEFSNSNIKNTLVSSPKWINFLNSRIFLISTGLSRKSHIVEKTKKISKASFKELVSMTNDGYKYFMKDKLNPADLGNLINQSWQIKRNLSSSVSNSQIDDVIGALLKLGAYGVKLCGAGGGGVIFAFAEKEIILKFKKKFNIDYLPISIEPNGFTRNVI